MERVLLLKTQLVEAAKLASSSDFSKQRLAVILLDNFIEIQLSTLMKKRFAYDDCFTTKPPKYKYTLRKKILNNYDDMLKECISENIITAEERDLLNFCHNVRNNLYHQAQEEHLLTSIALQFLNDIILKYQPDWRSARDFTSSNMNTKDPYLSGNTKSISSSNDKEEWVLFLKTYFNCLPENSKPTSALIAEHLLIKVGTAKDYYQFLLDEHACFQPSSENWELNEYLMFYSFYNVKKFELKNLKEENNSDNYNKGHKELIITYKNNWAFVRPNRLDKLEGHFKQIAKLSSHKALTKFMAFRIEMSMIYDALSKAASDLDAEIDAAIDSEREQSKS